MKENYYKKNSSNELLDQSEKQKTLDMISEGSPVTPPKQPSLFDSCHLKIQFYWQKFVQLFNKPN